MGFWTFAALIPNLQRKEKMNDDKKQIEAMKAYISYLYEAERQTLQFWPEWFRLDDAFLKRGEDLRKKIDPDNLPKTYETYASTTPTQEISTD